MTKEKDTVRVLEEDEDENTQVAEQEMDTTPSQALRKRRQRPRTQRIRTRQGPGLIFTFSHLLLWIITLASLLLNLSILRELAEAQATARESVLNAIAILDNFQEQRFAYTVTIDETMAVNTDMPVEETIPVSIDETMPINTVVTVPVKLGPLGTTNIDIPIITVIPVGLDFNVEIDQTFQVKTAVPIQLEVPVEIAVEDTPLHASLEDIKTDLYTLADQLSEPISPFSGLIGEPTVEVVE
jgi:hypothetical protein